MKFKKLDNIEIKKDEVCFKQKCGKYDTFGISKKIISYKIENDNGKDEILVLGKDTEGNLTALLFDEQSMKIKKQSDSKSYSDYTGFSKSLLNSRKKFSEEGDIGKARITYQLLQEWGY